MNYWLNGTVERVTYRGITTHYIYEKFDTYDEAIDRAGELDMDPDDFEIEYEY